jgi:uncharacterized membrane protein
MNAPTWPLTTAYLLHMLATVVWLGGLAALAFWVIPLGRRALDPPGFAALLERLQQKLDVTAWLSLALLAGTGMFQMSAHPAYEGFLSVQSRWAGALLAKHLVIFGMVGVNAYLTWGVMPRLRRLNLRQAGGIDQTDEQARLLRLNSRLLYLNLLLAAVVLAFTALARVS